MPDAGTAASDLAEQIRAAIRTGDLVPGQRLVEADLCARYGVSRAKVREAFNRLEAEGVVIIQPNRGASVRAMSRADVERLYEIREMLEGLAARLTARAAADSAVRDRLRSAREALDVAAAAGNVAGYMEENTAFHTLLVDISDNEFIGPLLDRTMLPMFRLQFYIAISKDVIQESHRQHSAILDALLAADEDEAERLMRAHVRTSLDLIRSVPDRFFKV